MRDILFRGKIKGEHKGVYELDWAFGDVVKELSTGRVLICDLSHFDEHTLLKDVLIEVIPETVGQDTGRKDKNGKKFFEGDICTIHEDLLEDELTALITFDEHKGKYLVKQYDPFSHKHIQTGDFDDWIKLDHFEVIGNIHDNPELLK